VCGQAAPVLLDVCSAGSVVAASQRWRRKRRRGSCNCCCAARAARAARARACSVPLTRIRGQSRSDGPLWRMLARAELASGVTPDFLETAYTHPLIESAQAPKHNCAPSDFAVVDHLRRAASDVPRVHVLDFSPSQLHVGHRRGSSSYAGKAIPCGTLVEFVCSPQKVEAVHRTK